MKGQGLEDHKQRVKAWDEGEVVFGSFECWECYSMSTINGGKASLPSTLRM